MARARVSNPDQQPWEGCVVLKRVPGRPQTGGRRYALLLGWPTPVSELAWTQFPPKPGRPSYCRAARQWAKAQLAANQARVVRRRRARGEVVRWIGPITLRWLRGVARGEYPLHHRQYRRLLDWQAGWTTPVSTAPPVKLQLRVGAGGVAVGWTPRA